MLVTLRPWLRRIFLSTLLVACASESSTEVPLEEVSQAAIPRDNTVVGGFTGPCYVVDGAFTGLDDPDTCTEFAGTGTCVGQDTALYVRHDEGSLHILVEIPVWKTPVEAEQFARFMVLADDGGQQWDVRVFGSGKPEILRNGWPYGGILDTAVGFGPSPSEPEDHVMFEVSIPIGFGPFSLAVQLPSATGVPQLTLVLHDMEMEGLAINFCPGGPGWWDWPDGTLKLISLDPIRGRPGDQVDLYGPGIGLGTVKMGGLDAQILEVGPYWIRAIVPKITGDALTWVTLADGRQTNRLVFFYDCEPDCIGECDPEICPGKPCGVCLAPDVCIDGECFCPSTCEGRECGDNGCGGSCGVCEFGSDCVGGLCSCVPKCSGAAQTACGPDGCGGSCGECEITDSCNSGQCCAPTCQGKQCGADGCGGQCGACPEDYDCNSGSCICNPKCDGKTCGDDGCGGVCGICVNDWVCVSGTCSCIPDCAGKECGDDGCSGSCGACPIGEECTKIGICVEAGSTE